MSALSLSSLLPFVPSGPDYPGARRFFAALGFEELRERDGFATFKNGDARFILQRLDNRPFAENFMIRINVTELDTWWRAVNTTDLEASFPGVRFKAPARYPWGRAASFVDLAGVCWHVGQQPE